MIIKSLEITNFGPIASVSFVAGMVYNRIGLTGPNGAGKSHVFRAIRYALSGELSDDNDPSSASSFIRHGASSAQVKLTFIEGANEVEITRSITKSGSKRSLTIKGPNACNDVTAAAAVTEKLNDVFGVDLSSALRCVFVPQGSFTKLLFGTWSDRESLLSRVMGAVDYSGVKKLMASRESELRATVRDIQPVIDNCMTQAVEIRKQLTISEQSIVGRDAVTELGVISGMRDSLRALATLASLNASLSAQVQQLGGYGDVRAIAERVDALNIEIKALTSEVDTKGESLSMIRRAIVSKQTTLTECNQVKSARATFQTLTEHARELGMSQIVESCGDYHTAFSGYRDGLRDWFTAQMDAANSRRLEAQTQLQRAEKMTQCAKDIGRLLERVEVLSKNRNQTEAELNAAQTALTDYTTQNSAVYEASTTSLSFLAKIKQHQQHGIDSSRCPVCNSVVNGLADLLTQEPALQKVVQDYSNTRLKMVSALQFAQRKLTEIDHELGMTRTNVDDLLKQLNGQDPLYVVAESPKFIQEKQNAMASEDLAIRNLAAHQQRYRQVLSVITAQVVELAASQSTNVSPEFMTSLETEIARMIESKQTQEVELEKLRATINTKRAEADAANAALRAQADAVASIGALQQRIADTQAIADRYPGINSTDVEARQIKYDELVSAIAAQNVYRNQLKGLEEQVHALQKELNNATKIREACAWLSVGASLFDKKGLQAEHLKRRFAGVIDHVNNILGVMFAGFRVRLSTTEELAFDVCHGSSSEWEPMIKLSGGQRVRLSVAFLLAVQATVLRNIGLLSLDEPSNHLDDEGVESMVAMLQGMHELWVKQGMTILICDHKKLFEQAFQAHIVLTE